MSGDAEPCPGEQQVPAGAPSAVADSETVTRLVPSLGWIIRDGKGQAALGPVAFPKVDLSGKDARTISVLRDMTEPAETRRRAVCMNTELAWTEDPVIARAPVLQLRLVCDTQGRREACVFADPTTAETDKFGACPTHASILRACPPLDMKQRLEWNRLRLALAQTFAEVRHVSGQAVI
jgi:hypothetical protein